MLGTIACYQLLSVTVSYYHLLLSVTAGYHQLR